MKKEINYRRLLNVITYSLYAVIFIIQLIYSYWVVATDRYHGQVSAKGGFLLIVFPLVRVAVMVVLNHIAKIRGDNKPFEKGEIWHW